MSGEPRPRLVVCEDDEPTRELLCDQLEAEGFETVPARDGKEAIRLAGLTRPDLMLLDINLPDGSGLDVLESIRGGSDIDPATPVIIVSGRVHEYDRLRGFERGASDFLSKPVFFPELVARIRLQLGRRPGAEVVRSAGEIVIDSRSRKVAVGDRQLSLAAKEFALLRMLVSEPNRVFTKQELLREVWGYRTLAHTRTLDAHASRLRRKLDPTGRRYVINVWGIGYRLLDPVRLTGDRDATGPDSGAGASRRGGGGPHG